MNDFCRPSKIFVSQIVSWSLKHKSVSVAILRSCFDTFFESKYFFNNLLLKASDGKIEYVNLNLFLFGSKKFQRNKR